MKTPRKKNKLSFHYSKHRKAKHNQNDKKVKRKGVQWKYTQTNREKRALKERDKGELVSLQSYNEIIKKLFKLFKEERNPFMNKIRGTFIL